MVSAEATARVNHACHRLDGVARYDAWAAAAQAQVSAGARFQRQHFADGGSRPPQLRVDAIPGADRPRLQTQAAGHLSGGRGPAPVCMMVAAHANELTHAATCGLRISCDRTKKAQGKGEVGPSAPVDIAMGSLTKLRRPARDVTIACIVGVCAAQARVARIERSEIRDQPCESPGLVWSRAHHPGNYARREKLASSTATIPVRKIPSKVPAPPIEATGAPSPRTTPRLSRSAPIRVPRLPPA